MNSNLMSNPSDFHTLPEHDREEIITALTGANRQGLLARVGLQEFNDDIRLADVTVQTDEENESYRRSGGEWDYRNAAEILAAIGA